MKLLFHGLPPLPLLEFHLSSPHTELFVPMQVSDQQATDYVDTVLWSTGDWVLFFSYRLQTGKAKKHSEYHTLLGGNKFYEL